MGKRFVRRLIDTIEYVMVHKLLHNNTKILFCRLATGVQISQLLDHKW